MAFYDFPGARVVDIRSVCILDIRCKVADDGEPGVFQAHVRVIFGPIFGEDRIFPACLFEGDLPVFDSFFQAL